ncbi:MAG TPA: FecR domain-containing protein [Polyangiaceae bacterium]
MSAAKEPLASPPRVATQDGEFGEIVRSASRYSPALDQAAAFRSLVERESAGYRARRSKAALSFALACLALAAALTLWLRARVPEGAAVMATGAGARPAPRATALPAGDTRLEDGTRVHLASQSSARVEATASGSRIALEAGKVTLEVTRQSAGRTLEVRSGSYRFVVLGTAFTVSSSPERVAASVSEGRVAVFRDQTRLAELRAGETWSSEANPKAEPAPAVATPPTPSAPRAPAELAPPSPPAEAQQPRLVAERECLAFARDGRARDAERCFVDQAAGGGLRAELALSELSRLRSDVLGDPAGALQALEQYRARFPSGSLRTEIDLSYVHVLVRMGRSRDVLAETDRLLGSGSVREREGELRMLRGNTLRAGLQDFATAEREYAAVERGAGKFAGEAGYYRGVCFEALGDGGAAAEAYRRYLRVPGRPREAEARKRLTLLPASASPVDSGH